MPRMSEKQLKLLKYVISEIRENGMPPSVSEMASFLKLKSKNAVARIVEKLIDAGMVAKDHLGRLMPSDTFLEIPKLGLVKAGIPSDVEELADTINLDNFLIGNKSLTYMLEVDGDSMIDAHIEKGDMVLVE